METLSTTDWIIIITVAITVSIISVWIFYSFGYKRGLPAFRDTSHLDSPKLFNRVIVINRITKINFISLGKSWEFEIDKDRVKEIIHSSMLRTSYINPDTIKILYDNKIQTYYGAIRMKVESIKK